MGNRGVLGICSLSAAFFLAGTSVVAVKFVSNSLAPFGLTFMSLVFAIAISLLVSGKELFHVMKKMGPEQYLALGLQGFLGIFLFRVCLTLALRFASAAAVGIVTGITPVVTALLAWVVLKEPVSVRGKAAIAVSLIGMLLLEKDFAAFQGGLHLLGIGLALTAVICESLFTILSRKLAAEMISPTVHAGLVSLVAATFCLVPALAEGSVFAVREMPAGSWLALLWYGGVVTIGAYSLMFYGARNCSGHTIAACSGIMPLSSVVLSVALLGESVAFHQWAGCAAVIGAIFLLIERED